MEEGTCLPCTLPPRLRHTEEPVCTCEPFNNLPSWGVPEPPCSMVLPTKAGFNPSCCTTQECYLRKYEVSSCPQLCEEVAGPYVAAGPSSIIRRTSLNIQSTACVVPGTKSLSMVYTVIHLYYTVLALLHA